MKTGSGNWGGEGNSIRDQLTGILAGLSGKIRDCVGPTCSIDMQPDTLDVAAAYRDREMRLRLLEKKSDLFQEILEALHRMETGSYGTCENCGEEIGLARLRASPTTALCLDCKKEQEQVLRNRELSFRTVSSLPA